jgi:hypothetical protein
MKPRTDLLRELALHLVSNKRGHKKFDFSTINNDINICGSAGCALGELPILYPNDWIFKNEVVYLIKDSNYSSFSDASKFFNIYESLSMHLFCPMCQDTELYGGQYLNRHGTAKEVSDNILAYCELVERSADPNHEWDLDKEY